MDGVASALEAGPEGLMELAPVAEGVEVAAPGHGVDEGGGGVVGGNRELDGEVADGMRERALVDAVREVVGGNPEPGEEGDFLLFGGKPG